MQDHSVAITPGAQASGAAVSLIDYAPRFNAAVAFVDRHLDEGRGDKIAIRTLDGRDVTFAELARQVNRWGNMLTAKGVSPGERQLMMVADCPEFFYAFWGAIKVGVIPVPVNTLLRAKDYRYMIEDSGASVVVWSEPFADEVAPALAEAATQPAHALPIAEAVVATQSASDILEPHPTTSEDDCFWLYSSGSTGFPKGAVHRHRDMVVTSQLYGVDVLGCGEGDVFFSAAKLFFAYGLGNAMTFPLWVGGTAVLAAPRPTPDMTFEVIERFKPSLYFGVPTLYAAQLAALDNAAPDLSSIRYCVSAGEALPSHLFRAWKERTGLVILDGIGSTEALHIFISNRTDDQRPGTSGHMVPGYEARIVGEDEAPVAPGQAGTLHIRGQSLARLYWNKPEKTAETMLADGWLSTGDTYRQDDDGYYVYEGRSDDMMKVGGIWTSPVEIEACLIEHPRVLEVAVVARADKDDLIKPEAWIVLKDRTAVEDDRTRSAIERELYDHVKKSLAPYKYPRWWHFADELPKTATGKIQRFKLRE